MAAEDDCPSPGAVFMEMSYCLKEKALKLRREDQTDPEDVLTRADGIQKRLKTNPKFLDREDVILITVCEMKETKPGVFTRSKKPFVEMEAQRSDSCTKFAKRATQKCHLRYKEKAVLSLFKVNGARVLNENITVKGNSKPWTLGNYLLLMKKSPSSVKMGIGYVQCDDSSSSSSEKEDIIDKRIDKRIDQNRFIQFKERCGTNKSMIVHYNRPLKDRPRIFTIPHDQNYIWTQCKVQDSRHLGTYQPEVDGYKVCCAQLDGIALLTPVNDFAGHMLNVGVLRNAASRETVEIEWESPPTIKVGDWKQAVTLFCIPSVHPNCTYCWKVVGGFSEIVEFPSTPFIYIAKAGLYQCIVKYAKKEIRGNLIHVSVVVDSDIDSSDDMSISTVLNDQHTDAGHVQSTFGPTTILGGDEDSANSGSACNPQSSNCSFQDHGHSGGGKEGDSGYSSIQHEHKSRCGRMGKESGGSGSVVVTTTGSEVCIREGSVTIGSRKGSNLFHGTGELTINAVRPPTARRSCDPPMGPCAASSQPPVSVNITSPSVVSCVSVRSSFGQNPVNVVAESNMSSLPSWSSVTSKCPSGPLGHVSGPMLFTEKELSQGTDDYSESCKLGVGGFGVVYKGVIRGSRVAVKKLTEGAAVAMARKDGHPVPEQFALESLLESELKALTREQSSRHRNLLDLMGYCIQPPILVYEFMEEGSLHDKLFKTPLCHLTWLERSHILKDACRGLTWLHGTSPPIVHGDMKASNILLDKHLTAKLGDFGFAQELPLSTPGHTMVTAVAVAKSLGYCPPELDTCRISPKSDVYSYGVITLETFSGKSAFDVEREDKLLVEHFDDMRRSLEGYKDIADASVPGQLYPYLLKLYRKIIEGSLMKHSKRASSEEVMKWWNETNF